MPIILVLGLQLIKEGFAEGLFIHKSEDPI